MVSERNSASALTLCCCNNISGAVIDSRLNTTCYCSNTTIKILVLFDKSKYSFDFKKQISLVFNIFIVKELIQTSKLNGPK